jgi:hypothetical protein
MRTVRRLRLRFLLDLRSSPTVLSTLLLFALSNLGQAHYKTYYQSPGFEPASLIVYHDFCGRASNMFYGGPGGIRTRVQNTFLFASYSNIFIYYTTTSIIDNTFFPPNPILNLRKVFVYISLSVVIILLSSSIGSDMSTLPGAVPLVTKSKAAPNSSM